MEHGAHEHLEHAEHAEHAAHDPFDRRVAMTITIIAAVVAVVGMFSHRGHTEVLSLKAESAINQSKANIFHTRASDQWNFYQAKNIRSYLFQNNLVNLLTAAPQTGSQAEQVRQGAQRYLISQVDKYEGSGYWNNLLTSDFQPKKKGGKKVKGGELAQLQAEAKGLVHQAEEYQEKAEHLEEQSEHVHHNVSWLDFGNLGLELGLVLCSVAVLTKQRGFWFTGMAVAAVGLGIACLGIYGLYVAPAL